MNPVIVLGAWGVGLVAWVACRYVSGYRRSMRGARLIAAQDLARPIPYLPVDESLVWSRKDAEAFWDYAEHHK